MMAIILQIYNHSKSEDFLLRWQGLECKFYVRFTYLNSFIMKGSIEQCLRTRKIQN
jgi:hypothetical protein